MQEPEDDVAWAGQVLTPTAFLLFVSISSHSRNTPHDLLLSPSERCHSPDCTHLWQSQFWWEPASKMNPGAPWFLQVDDPPGSSKICQQNTAAARCKNTFLLPFFLSGPFSLLLP